MKVILNIAIVVAAGYLGYLVEPSLRATLTGLEPSAAEKAANTRIMLQLADGTQVDLASLSADELPKDVTIHSGVDAVNTAAKQVMRIDAGSRVKLVRIEGGNAVISPTNLGFVGRIPVGETDLIQWVVDSHLPAAPQGGARPTSAGTISEPSAQPVVDTAEAELVPAPVVEPPNVQADESASAQVAKAAPDPGVSDVVQVMKNSIKAAPVTEFTGEQVLEWKAEGDEIVDGEKYQVGVVSYQAETIFGVKTLQAKALVRDGKVQRWIRPKSGVEIK